MHVGEVQERVAFLSDVDEHRFEAGYNAFYPAFIDVAYYCFAFISFDKQSDEFAVFEDGHAYIGVLDINKYLFFHSGIYAPFDFPVLLCLEFCFETNARM